MNKIALCAQSRASEHFTKNVLRDSCLIGQSVLRANCHPRDKSSNVSCDIFVSRDSRAEGRLGPKRSLRNHVVLIPLTSARFIFLQPGQIDSLHQNASHHASPAKFIHGIQNADARCHVAARRHEESPRRHHDILIMRVPPL